MGGSLAPVCPAGASLSSETAVDGMGAPAGGLPLDVLIEVGASAGGGGVDAGNGGGDPRVALAFDPGAEPGGGPGGGDD
jgi:hypothetical protein